MKWIVTTILSIMTTVGACAPAKAPSSPTLPPPQASETSSPPTQPPATAVTESQTTQLSTTPVSLEPTHVEIEGAEGLVIHATFYPANHTDAPGVVLLHMLGGNRADWAELASQLQGEGIASLAIDLRGHGDTAGARDWGLAQEDVARALAWLTASEVVDPNRTAIIGASIGANLALVAGTADADVEAVASLSPGLDYFGVKTLGLLADASDQEVLLVASEDDVYSADTVKQLAGESKDRAQLLLFDTAGHGTRMLSREPQLSDRLIEFLQQAFEA